MDLQHFASPSDEHSHEERLRSVLVTPYWPRSIRQGPRLPQGYYVCSGCQRMFSDIRSKQAHKCRQLR